MERKIKFLPKEYYHLYSRGVEKRKIFLDEKDRERFIALLYIMNQSKPFVFRDFLKSHKLVEIFSLPRERQLVSILSYVLMPNHFHILIYEKEDGGISKFMMRLLTAYSMYFNTKYKRSGPLFVHPFKASHISNEPQYLWIFSYIHLNPIKLVRNKTIVAVKNFLESYKYSSYPEYFGEERISSKILDLSLVPDYMQNVRLNLEDYEKYTGYERYTKSTEGSPLYERKERNK